MIRTGPGLGVNFILCIIIVGIFGLLASSCQRHEIEIDPAAPTQGYKLFTGKTKGLRVSFEYPDTWRRVSAENSGAYNYMPLLPPDFSVIVSSNKLSYGNAVDAIQSTMRYVSQDPNFKVLGRSTLLVGNVEAQEAIYDHTGVQDAHGPPVYFEPGEIVTNRQIAIDYKGRVYSLFLVVVKNRFERANVEFEHLLATFRFLD